MAPPEDRPPGTTEERLIPFQGIRPLDLHDFGEILDRVPFTQHAPLKKAAGDSADAAFSALGPPSRAQVTAIARQQMDIEERLEGLEERLEHHVNSLMSRMNDVMEAIAGGLDGARRSTLKKGD